MNGDLGRGRGRGWKGMECGTSDETSLIVWVC